MRDEYAGTLIMFKIVGDTVKYGKAITIIISSMLIVVSVSGCTKYPKDMMKCGPSYQLIPQQTQLVQMDTANMLLTELPDQLQIDAGVVKINADIVYPQQLTRPIASYKVEYGGSQYTISQLQQNLMPTAIIQNMTMVADEQGGTELSVQIATQRDSSGMVITGEMFTYPGRFTYWEDLPDGIISETIDGDAGQIEENGTPMQCALPAVKAYEIASEFLAKGEVDLDLGEMRLYAISPTREGRYVEGYYVITAPQLIDGIPVALYHNCGMSSSMIQTGCGESPTGFRFRVFDDAIENVTAFWLNENTMRTVEKYESLISFESAISIVQEWAKENVRTKTLTIREIRFEYALLDQNGEMMLVPSWSFDTLEGIADDSFYGVQIDATNGTIIRAVEEFLL